MACSMLAALTISSASAHAHWLRAAPYQPQCLPAPRCPLTGPSTPFFTLAVVMLIYARPVPLRCPPAAGVALPSSNFSTSLVYISRSVCRHCSSCLLLLLLDCDSALRPEESIPRAPGQPKCSAYVRRPASPTARAPPPARRVAPRPPSKGPS